MKISFEIVGKPFGKERPHFRRYGKPYTPDKTSNYEQTVALAYKSKYGRTKFPPDAALGIDIVAFMPIPKSTPKYKRPDMIMGTVRPMVTPDWDNIGKIICDALNGIAYVDDRKICEARVRKFYGEEPKTVVTVYTVE